MSSWNLKKGKKRKNPIRSDAKFDHVKTIPIVRNLVALGMSEVDIGIILEVSPQTLKSWKKRYPNIFDANKEGKKIMRGILCAEMMRAAMGYDYIERDDTYKDEPILDEAGNPTGELKSVKVKTVEHTKHQPGNASLMEFLANNLLPTEFPRNGVTVENNIIAIVGAVEEEKIRQFAGKLLDMSNRKTIESKVTDVNQSGQPESTNNG